MEECRSALVLRGGREKPVRQRHPWIFSGAVERIDGPKPEPGELVAVATARGEQLATAYYNPRSQIIARVLSWDPKEAIDDVFWLRRLAAAIALRQLLGIEPATTAYRLVYAESDGLPGLIVDRYGPYLVMQCLTLGIDRRKELLVGLLQEVLRPRGILERSDSSVRKQEGLEPVSGRVWGEKPPEQLEVLENGHTFLVDVFRGHKTGLYLDQRDNRALVCAKGNVSGRDVLNVFAYTGGFAVYAASNGARSIVNVDDSDDALKLAALQVEKTGGERANDRYLNGDAFHLLRKMRDRGDKYDMVILDPPKFAYSQRDVEAACRGYKDLNLLAMRLLRPDGLLATFSCSGRVSANLFQKVVFGAALDAQRDVQIVRQLFQPGDHPVLLSFPESAYLKGFLCRVA
jgi:23S rRNA (cytosine1962-C5)-methyltransferase